MNEATTVRSAGAGRLPNKSVARSIENLSGTFRDTLKLVDIEVVLSLLKRDRPHAAS
jgi:hypothetical protein